MRKIIGIFIFMFVLIFAFGCNGKSTDTNQSSIDTSTQIESITIIFETNGGSPISDLTITTATISLDIPTTTKDGYVFAGWYLDSDLEQRFGDTIPALTGESITLYAMWTPDTHTFIFVSNGGLSVDDLVLDYGSPISLPTPLRVGYRFLGWFEDENLSVEFDQSAALEETQITLYAKWELITGNVTIKPYFESLNQGEFDLGQTEVTVQAAGTNYTYTPIEHLGFTFDSENENNVLTIMVLEDNSSVIEVYYNRNIVTVSYETNASISVVASEGLYNSVLTEPETPVRTGYEFVNWFSDEGLTQVYVFDKYPTSDITIYAGWIGVPSTINFDTNGGEVITELTQNTGTEISLPTPVKIGFDFLGWFESPLLQTAFSSTLMPAGEITIYAKWEPKTFSISYNSLGGSTIISADFDFGETIVLADDPTKDDFIFGGWFLEESLSTPFNYSTMPANDLLLYAKWIDASDPYSIIVNVNKDSGVLVVLRGVVYAKHNNSYMGYYVGDDTGKVYVYADNSSVNIGEELEIEGMLLFDSFNQPYLQGTSVTVLNTEQPTRTPEELRFSEYDVLEEHNDLFVSEIFTTEGIIFNDNNNYFLVDPVSLVRIPVSLKSLVPSTELQTSENQNFIALYVLNFDSGIYKAVLLDLVSEELTEADKLLISQNIISNHIVKPSYLESQFFDIPTVDMFGFTEITYIASVNGSFFDSLNDKFLDVSEDELITFTFTLTTAASETTSFTIDVIVKPIHITSIADMINGVEGDYYQIQGVVVSRGDGNLIILKDDTGFVFVQDAFFLEIGDEVILNVKKQTEGKMVLITSENEGLYLTSFIDSEVELNLIPEVKTIEDILALDYADPSIYGKYYEVRGFLLPEQGDFHTTHNLVMGENKIPVSSYTYQGFENLMDYEYLEIIIRVYLTSGVDGPILSYEGIRQDIKIPDYSDQELVDTIYQIFLYLFSDREYEAFEEFYLFPYHPVLGGNISWALDSTTEGVYDYNNQQFLYDFVDTPLAFTVNISKGTSSKTIVYQTMLNKIEPISFDSFYSGDKGYGNYFIKGTIVYWHPYFSYIMDDLGNIIIVEEDLEGVKKGDIVLLYVEASYQYDNSIFFRRPYGEENCLIEIISRDNPVDISFTSMDVSTLQGLDFTDSSVYHDLVEIEGKLIKIDDYTLAIESAYGLVYIDYPDNHTYFNLAQFTNQYISIKGFVHTYDNDDGSITLRYVGRDVDLNVLSYSNIDKIAIIKAFILDEYQKPMIGDISFDFFQVYDIFDEGTFSFTPLNDTSSVLNITSGYINSVLEITVINVDVIIEIGGVTETFTMTMNIKPMIPVGTIADLKTNVNESYIVNALVVAVTRTAYDQYCLMVEGYGGTLLLYLNHEQYYMYNDYNGYVGEIIEFIGFAEKVKGRYEVTPESFRVESRAGIVEAIFEEKEISDLLALSLFDETIYGKPYQITGLVEKESENNAELYYVNDGINRILITTNELYYGILNEYVGYDVTLKGFVFGENSAFEKEEITLIVNKYKYDGENSIVLANYTDQEIVDILLENVLYSYQQNYMNLNPGDTGSYVNGVAEPIASSYPEATITATVLSGIDFIDFYGGYFTAKNLKQDERVEILIDISCNSATTTTVLEFKINGYQTSSFLDLFGSEEGTEEIVLEAELVLKDWGYSYFKIGEYIYYLETKAYINAYPGEKVLLIGKKNIIDGIADYTYDISVVSLYEYPYTTLEPTTNVTISDLYSNDYSLLPLQREYLQVSGVLGYDPYLELYTLTDDGKMIYVRYSDYYSYEDYLSLYIGYPILLDIFLPMDYIFKEYMLVDTFGTTSDFEIDTLTDVEALDFAQNYLETYFIDKQIQAGSSINSFPFYHDVTSCSYTYSLVNTTDSNWIDMFYYTTNITDVVRNIELEVLIELDGSTETRTVNVDFDLIPNETLTVKEALYSPYSQLIQVQGVVTYINNEYLYIIISDGNYNYAVSIDNSVYSLFDMINTNFSLGDEVLIAGMTDYFSDSEYIVYMNEICAVNTISTGNSYILTPEVMTFEELMFMDYLDPINYFKYIEIEETLTWNDSSMYPSYQLTDLNRYVEEYGEYFDIEIIPSISAIDFHDIINSEEGNTLKVIGFIYLESIYTDFYFSIALVDYDVIPV